MRVKFFLLLSVSMILVFGVGAGFLRNEPKVEYHQGENYKIFKDLLEEHVLTIEPHGDQVLIITDEVFSVGKKGKLMFVGDSFSGEFDHHSETTFMIQKIEELGVTIKYESKFDHRAFSRDLISIDRAEVYLDWR